MLICTYQKAQQKGPKQSVLQDMQTGIFHVLIPSSLYVVQNNLLFYALSNLEVSIFQVTYQLKVAITAVLSVLMLEKRISQVSLLSSLSFFGFFLLSFVLLIQLLLWLIIN